MSIYRLGDEQPDIAASAYVAPGAALIGRVSLLAGASVWFNATLRGDNERIVVGIDSNVQDGAVLHTDPGSPLTIGSAVTVGHQAMLHGCVVGDGSLIGMQAIVLNGAIIGRESLVAAGALVGAGKQFPERVLILGSPARVSRPLTEAELAGLRESARVYSARARQYRELLRPL